MKYVQDLVMDLCKSMLWKRVLSFYLWEQSVLYWNASVLWNTFKEFVFLWFLQKLQLRQCYFFYAYVNVSECTKLVIASIFTIFSGFDIFQLADISPEMGCNIWRIRNNLSIKSGTKISRFSKCGLVHVKCPRTRCNLSIFENFLSISL